MRIGTPGKLEGDIVGLGVRDGVDVGVTEPVPVAVEVPEAVARLEGVAADDLVAERDESAE